MLSIRKIGMVGRTYLHLNRYRQILAALFRYGFGDVVELLKIEQYLEVGLQFISKKGRERIEKFSRAERIRMALEELGPTYIKLGQILSTRPDLVAADFIAELSRLQDEVPGFPHEDARAILEKELGANPETLFKKFEPQPFASASIGQVYRAELEDGETVAIKIQRPGIRRSIEIDLEILLHLATLMERNIAEMAIHRPVTIVEEFARTLEREIDFTIEATSMERISHQFLEDETIYIPKVYRDLTTAKVLTMEYVEGVKIGSPQEVRDAGLDPQTICLRGADFSLKQIFSNGFFHADPHPGNILLLPGNVICLLDFGMMGHIDRQMREHFVDLIDAVVHRQEEVVAQVLVKFTEWDELPDMRLLERDVTDFLNRHLFRPLSEISIGKVLQHLLELAGRHRLRIPPNIFLMLKALGTVEGVARSLDPDFDMISRAAPYVEAVKLARFHPQRVADDMSHVVSELLQFLHQTPNLIMEFRQLLQQRKISLRLEHADLQSVLSTNDQTSNRISFAIVIAALLIGSALIVISNTPPLFFGISLIGIIGFLAAALMGIWLLVAIVRRGRL